MKHVKLLLVITLAGHSAGIKAHAQRDNHASAKAQAKVGMVTRSFVDEKRKNWQGTAPRPLKTCRLVSGSRTRHKRRDNLRR